MKYNTTYSDVGRLRQRVELQRYVTAPDGQGGTTATWEPIDSVWADIKPISGTERYEIESLKGNITHTVRIRFFPNIDNENRVVFNNKVFFIKHVLNKGFDNVYMELAVTEEV